MTLWSRISDALAALAQGEGLGVVFERLRGQKSAPETSVAFTIATIALSAKMAKADGLVTQDEVRAFRSIFHIPADEEKNAARVFNLARRDIAGFEVYAAQIAQVFRRDAQVLCDESRAVLIDLLEALFQIAMADGKFHPREDVFLAQVAQIFGLSTRCYRMIRARMTEGGGRDPYEVLGLPPHASVQEVRAAWRQAVKDSHPDRMMARGIPPEAIKLAERRLIAVNEAWEEISHRHNNTLILEPS